MISAMMTIVTSSCAMFMVARAVGRPSNASCVMNRAAVNPVHSSTPVTTAAQKNEPS